jgi:hypothetical protein
VRPAWLTTITAARGRIGRGGRSGQNPSGVDFLVLGEIAEAFLVGAAGQR